MTAEGFAAAAALDESDVESWIDEWQRRTFVTPVETKDHTLDRWTVPVLLRSWLLKELPKEERTDAHQAAGEWLKSERSVKDINEVSEQAKVDDGFLEQILEERHQFIKGQVTSRALEANHIISMILSGRGNHREVIKLNQKLSEVTTDPNPLNWYGRALAATGQLEEASECYRRALDTASDQNRSAESIALHGLASVKAIQGDFTEAERFVEEALNLRREDDDIEMVISSLSRLGDILAEQGLYDDAESVFRDALERSESHEIKYGQAQAIHGLGSVEMERGDYREAKRHLRESLKLRVEIGRPESIGTSLHQLAQLELRNKNHSVALDLLKKAINIFMKHDDVIGVARARHQAGTVLFREEELEAAEEQFEEAKLTFEEHNVLKNLSGVIHDLACVNGKKKNKERALSGFIRALRIRQNIHDRSGEAATLAQLGHLAAEEKMKEIALKLYIISYNIFEKINHGDKDRVGQNISHLADRIGYSKRFVHSRMKQRMKSEYEKDRGWSLLREAFPDADFPDAEPPSGDEIAPDDSGST